MRGGATPRGDEAVDAIARMLGALPPVFPASGSCRPIEPSDLSFSRHEPRVPSPEIKVERLQTFPDITAPLHIPPPSSSPPRLRAWLMPTRRPARAPRSRARPRRFAWAIDALVLIAVAGVVVLRSPLATHPAVRPYAEATRAAIVQGEEMAARALVRGASAVAAATRAQ